MDEIDYWKICDHVTIFQAVMLILGLNPEYEIDHDNRPKNYIPLLTAIENGAKHEKIQADLAWKDDPYDPCALWLDIDETYIEVESLKSFLKERGIKTCYFYDQEEHSANYLNSKNPFYAPKLAAAVSAWEHITKTPESLNGKTPKQALEKWLREHASAYDLTKEDGKLNEAGIENIAKIANWKPEGGAAKTPTHAPIETNPTTHP